MSSHEFPTIETAAAIEETRIKDLQLILAEFEIHDAANPIIESLRERGADRIAGEIDWDGVLAVKDIDGIGGTTWAVMRRNMTPDNQAEHKRLYGFYHPLETKNLLTNELASEWQSDALRLNSGTPLNRLIADAHDNVRMRPGATDLLAYCHEFGIPVQIKSTGSAEIIETALNRDLDPEVAASIEIYSNRFILDNNGVIIGYSADDFVHSQNKHAFPAVQPLHYRHRDTRIVIGDNPHDTGMTTTEQHDTLKIRVDGGSDHYQPEDWQAFVSDSYVYGYHAVAKRANLIAVHGLMRFVTQDQAA